MKKPQGKNRQAQTPAAPQSPPLKKPAWVSEVSLGVILLITLIVYKGSLSNQLLWWDDNKYVFENKTIQSLSMDNIETMFDTFTVGGYTPLVSLSLAIDYQLYGLKEVAPNVYSGHGYHLTSLLIHLLSVIVLYFLCMKLSRSVFVSATVAALFAIHPMNVESVAWVTERKDQLYVLFYLLAMFTYLNYIDKGFKAKYLFLAGVFFLLSLFSKGMAITLPAVLFLLDYYRQRKPDLKMFLEKIPFVMLSVAFGVVAISAISHRTETLVTDPGDRLHFASYGVINYFTKLFVPYQMSVFYPFPLKTSNGYYPIVFYLCDVIVTPLILLVWKFRRDRTVAFGALFFLCNIILILQLKSFGGSFLGDRFTYLAGIGIFFIAAVMLEKFLPSVPKTKYLILTCGVVYLLFLAVTATERTKDWYSTITLWEDAVRKFPNSNDITETCSRIFTMHENFEGAIPYIDRSIVLSKQSEWGRLYAFKAYVHFKMEQHEAEMQDLNLALQYEQNPCSRAKIFSQRGRIYVKASKKKEAMSDFEQSFYAAQSCPGFDLGRLQSDVQAAKQLPD